MVELTGMLSNKNTEFKLSWDETEEYVIFKEIDEDGKVILEFALDYPRYAKLYYALKEWYGD